MEALIYLSSTGQAELREPIRDRIKFLQTSELTIIAESDDVVHTLDGYSKLEMNKDEIIRKYDNALRNFNR